MKKRGARLKPLKLSWDEIGLLAGGLSFASRPMKLATQAITEEYSLGPRGAWILVLITTGQVFPLDLTNVFRIGRSLVTAELIPLTKARLITYRKSLEDGRRVELALTAAGEKLVVRIRAELSNLIIQRLANYTRDEILLCSRMLNDFISPKIPTAQQSD
jgi:DNA-binding MarR family transcriptional regulator